VLDTILDLFDRRRKGATRDRSGGEGGLLGRIGNLVDGDHDDDRRHRDDRRDDRWRDDDDDHHDDYHDDDERGRRRSGRRGDGFDFG
jgi:hypothetical protein